VNNRVLKYFKYNILIKVKFLKYLFKIPDEFTEKEQEAYINIQLYYSKLDFAQNKLNLLRNPKQRRYILNGLFGTSILNRNQKIRVNSSLVIGRKSNYRNKIKLSCFDRIGFINYDIKDDIYLSINSGIKWLQFCKTDEVKNWTIENIPLEYLPNMNNIYSELWDDFKKEIAIKRGELTLINGISIEKRKELHKKGILKLEDWNAEDNCAPIKDGALTIKDGAFAIKENPAYIDFEYINDFNDNFDKYPYTKDNSCLYLIGVFYKNKYYSFIIDYLKIEEECKNFLNFIEFIKKNKINILYHWGAFEKIQIYKLIQKYNLNEEKVFIDTLTLFDVNVYIKKKWPIKYLINNFNIFNYGIKEIAKGLYQKKIIKNKWAIDMTGNDTMLLLWTNSNNDKTIIDKIINYNKSDCVILYDIVKYLKKIN
jgi:hypothetical protein